jgi:hypothetical protein
LSPPPLPFYQSGMKHFAPITTPTNTGGQVVCPHCRSTAVHAEKRGWNLSTGFLGSSRIMLTCLSCGWIFAPPEDPRTKWGRWIICAVIFGFIIYAGHH